MPSTRTQQALARLADLTPRQVVAELDRYIVGQADAKKAVAIALRNRWRRQQAPESIRDEISPNNIILIGPTGVGKTEIARQERESEVEDLANEKVDERLLDLLLPPPSDGKAPPNGVKPEPAPEP